MTNRPGQKLFYKIGEVSSLTGVETYILRYWESEFPKLAPRKNKGGQRVYRQKDLDLVFTIKRMLHEEGYTIAGARRKLGERVSKSVAVDSVPSEYGPVKSVAGGSGDELTDKLASLKKEIKDVLDIIK